MKIIASDYDGTLNRGTVSEKDIMAIKRWRASGNRFGMVSGRTALNLVDVMREHGAPFDFIIGLTGSVILDANGVLLDERLSSMKLLSELLPLLAESENRLIEINTHEGTTCLHCRADGKDKLLPSFIGQEGVGFNLPFSQAMKLRGFSQISILYPDKAQAGRVTMAVNNRFAGRLLCYQNDSWVNLVPVGSGKAEGIRRYLRLIGEPDACVLPVGDNLNDLEMIREFGGCTIDTAVPAVLAATNCIHASIADMIDAHI